MEKASLLLDIQRRIQEIKAKGAEYKDLEILDSSLNPVEKPHVGIWWLHSGIIIRHSVEAAECTDPDDPQCVEVEHIYVWPLVQEAFSGRFPEFLELKYSDVSRGRVWYHRVFEQYSITCAPVVANAPNSIRAVASAFGIGGRGFSVIIDPQYPR